MLFCPRFRKFDNKVGEQNMKKRTPAFIVGLVLLLSLPTYAQTTAFNFQGLRMNDGTNPANGRNGSGAQLPFRLIIY